MQLEAFGLDPAQYEGKVDEIQAAIRWPSTSWKRPSPTTATLPMRAHRRHPDQHFPNAIVTYQPEMLWFMRLRPHATDPNQCYLDKLSFERFPNSEEQRFLEGTDNLKE